MSMKKRNLWIIIITVLILIILIAAVYSVFIKKYKISQQLIGGCAGVSAEDTQECCDNWARENNILKIQCVGEWEIKNNQCSWKCTTG